MPLPGVPQPDCEAVFAATAVRDRLDGAGALRTLA
jgi:hypothetical protein